MRYEICNCRRDRGLRWLRFTFGGFRMADAFSRRRDGGNTALSPARPVRPLAAAVSPSPRRRAAVLPRRSSTAFPLAERRVLRAAVPMAPVTGPADPDPPPAPRAVEFPVALRRFAPPPENRRAAADAVASATLDVASCCQLRCTPRPGGPRCPSRASLFSVAPRDYRPSPRLHSADPTAPTPSPTFPSPSRESTTVSFPGGHRVPEPHAPEEDTPRVTRPSTRRERDPRRLRARGPLLTSRPVAFLASAQASGSLYPMEPASGADFEAGGSWSGRVGFEPPHSESHAGARPLISVTYGVDLFQVFPELQELHGGRSAGRSVIRPAQELAAASEPRLTALRPRLPIIGGMRGMSGGIEPHRTARLGVRDAAPSAAWPRNRNVFGCSPSPHSLKDPKSLYQGPSGASGPDSRHALSFSRSSPEIRRSAARRNRCFRSASGRFVHSILGITHRRSGGQAPR